LAAHAALVERSARLLENALRPTQRIEMRQTPASSDPEPIRPIWTRVKAGRGARTCEVLFDDEQRAWQLRVHSDSRIMVKEFAVGAEAFAAAVAMMNELERDGRTAP
jgi:hypothetical protein